VVTVAVLAVVVCLLVVAAVVDWRSRGRGGRNGGKAMAAELDDRRRDLRARRSMMNLGGDEKRRDPYR
jgi:hypothetical protein